MTKRKFGTEEWAIRNLNIFTGCSHDCKYCVSGETLILMADGSQKKIKNISVGDKILGVKPGKRFQKLKKAAVLNHWSTNQQAYRIVMKNGTILICSGNHRWLTGRGWKHTSGKEFNRRKKTRDGLTLKNKISYIELPEEPLKRIPNWGKRLSPICNEFNETTLYMRGYLNGLIRGDGHLGIHKTFNKSKEKQERLYQFRLSMIDKIAVDTAKKYLNNFGIELFEFIQNNDKYKKLYAIRTSKRKHRKRIQRILEWSDSPEFMRGFISGIFDAEGSSDNNRTIRISNANSDISEDIENSLNYFDFNFVYESKKSNNVKTIRIKSDIAEYIRFFQLFKPKISRKFKLEGFNIKMAIGIKSIERIGQRKLYDITTTTENFIANGFISHNCYARYNWCKRWKKDTVDNWKNMKLNERLFWEKPKLIKEGRCMFPTRHDILPEHIEETLDYLGRWLAVGNEILIVSKPHLEVIRALCQELEKYKEQITFRFTIGSLDDKILKFWEPNAPSYKERMQSLRHAYEHGYKTSVSCEPYLDKNIYLLAETFFPYVNDTIWIGLMNFIDQRVGKRDELVAKGWSDEDFKYLDMVRDSQTDEFIRRLYELYKNVKKIKWKDSIKEVLGLPEEEIG